MPSTLWSGKPRAPFPWLKPTTKELVEEELMSRFRTEAERQFNMREAFHKNVYIRDKYFKLARKKKLYDEYRRKVYGKQVKEEYAKALHAAMRTSWHQMEAIDELTAMGAREKVATKLSLENREEWITTQTELNNFDHKREEELQLVEASLSSKGKGGKGVGKPPKGPLPKGTAEPARKLAAQKGKKQPYIKEVETLEMPDLVLMAQRVGKFVEAVKAKKAKEITDKFERDQLERKEKLDKATTNALLKVEMEKKMREAAVWELSHGQLALQLQDEQRIARDEEEKQAEYRRQMALALMETRKVEWEEVTNRDHEMYTMMRQDYGDEVFQEWLLWKEEKEKRAEEKRLNRLRACTEIILQIVTMMEIKNDYNDEFNSRMPASTWRGWKTLFIKGHILPCPICSDDLLDDQPWSDPNQAFAKEAMTQYLEEQGEWESMYVIGKNKELGSILWEILGVADSPPARPDPINLTQFKLKMAVVGAAYTGKTTVAKNLELNFDIVKIEISNVISSALALADVEEQKHKFQLAQEAAEKIELEAQRIKEERQKIADDLELEASGKKELVLRGKRNSDDLPSESPPVKSPKDDKSSKREQSPEKGKQGKEKQEKVKQKDADASAEKRSKEEPANKMAFKSTDSVAETLPKQDEYLELVPRPIPDPEIDLSYFTPKARFGMDIRLAQEKGLQPPARALAGLAVLTMSNLQEYADAYAEMPNPKKGTKGGPAAKKGAPPTKEGKAGGKGTDSKGATGKKGTPPVPEAKQWGFVLDGFPSNAEEAKALELQLTGLNQEYTATHLAKASKIAPPPVFMENIISGLDGILHLETLEEREALKRAMGKVLDPKTGKIYHLDYDPPPTKEKGLAQRLKPLEELEDVRRRLLSGAETWAPLPEFLSRFSNVFVVRQVDEDNKKIVDLAEPCNLAQKFLDAWGKTQAAKGAAQAALEAETSSAQALADTEKASKVAIELAEHFWDAKLAEIETEKGLDALGGNPLAKKLVKEKVTVTLTKAFDETCKAVKEAEEAAECARAFAMQAEQMAHEAKAKVSEADLEFAFHVRAEAEAAAEAAKEAAVRADASLHKAEAAFEIAKKALDPPPEEEKAPPGKESAKKDKEAGKNEKEWGKKQKEALGKTDSKGAKEETKASKKQVSKDESLNTLIPSAVFVASPEPPKLPSLEEEFAVALNTEWENIEAKYFEDLESVFATLHQERAITRDEVVGTISNFVAHLSNRDDRQLIFNEFQEKYNRVAMADRRDKKVKPKLHQEVVKLEKTFQQLMDTRSKKCWELSEKSLIALLDSRVESLVDLFTTLIQTEWDRHLHTCSFLNKYFSKTIGTDVLADFSCNLREVNTEPQAGFPVQGWLISISSPLPKLHKVIMTAMSMAYDVMNKLTNQEPEIKTKKKGEKVSKGEKRVMAEKTSEKAAKKDKPKKSEKKFEDADGPKETDASTEIVETPPPAIEEGCPPATAREHQVFLQRLQRIAKVALKYFIELQPIVDGAYRRMDEWGMSRLNVEAEVVREVLYLATQAVDENIPLWYKVYMNQDQFLIDESQLQMECSVTQLTNLDVWHCKIMESLLEEFRKLPLQGEHQAAGKSKQKRSNKKNEKRTRDSKKGPQNIDASSAPTTPLGNFITGAAAKAAADLAIESVHTSFKDDLKESLMPRLPASKENPRGPFQDWQNISNFMFQELLADESKASKFIEWRALLVALVDAHYDHMISRATREDIFNARTAFIDLATKEKPQEVADLLDLKEFLSIPLWFDSSTPVAEGEFDLAISVKIFVFNVLDDGWGSVPWMKLLLYLCRDTDPYLALQKAFTVVAGQLSDDAHLTPEEVLQIIYPGGIDSAWKAEIVPFILEDIENLLYHVAKERYIRAEKESDFGGSDESGSNKLSVERPSSESSDSEHGTVTDFLDFTYKDFPELIQAETVSDFLESLGDVAPLLPLKEPYQEPPYICDVHDVPTEPARELADPDEFAIPEFFTVDDIVQTEAVKRLRDMLYCNYGSDILQLFDKTPVADDIVEDPDQTEGEGTQKKGQKEGQGGDGDEKEKKKKANKKK